MANAVEIVDTSTDRLRPEKLRMTAVTGQVDDSQKKKKEFKETGFFVCYLEVLVQCWLEN